MSTLFVKPKIVCVWDLSSEAAQRIGDFTGRAIRIALYDQDNSWCAALEGTPVYPFIKLNALSHGTDMGPHPFSEYYGYVGDGATRWHDLAKILPSLAPTEGAIPVWFGAYKPCECGAKHTPNPNLHAYYCPRAVVYA